MNSNQCLLLSNTFFQAASRANVQDVRMGGGGPLYSGWDREYHVAYGLVGYHHRHTVLGHMAVSALLEKPVDKRYEHCTNSSLSLDTAQ